MGIGKATALALGRQGALVVINGRTPSRLQATADEFDREGISVLPIQGDVANSEDVQRLVAKTIDAFGRLDILINNAGISMRGAFEDLQDDVIQKVVGSNFVGSINMSRAALPYLRETKGHLVFVSSLAGIRGLPLVSVYSASKMALTGLAESLRLELMDNGIHVGIVYVGITQNEAEKTVLRADGKPITLQWRGIDRGQQREQVASAILKNIRQRKFKSVLTGLGRFEAIANRVAPGFVEQILKNAHKKVEEGLK